MRKNFPTLRLNKGYIYLDNAAMSLKLGSVIQTLEFFMKKFPLNLHSMSNSADYLTMERTVRSAREVVAKWINANSNEISFVPSATYALNFLALSFAELVGTEHSIATTKAEHSSNIYPWIALCKKKKVKLHYLHLNKQFAIDKERICEEVNTSTIVVSFAHVSNSLGSLNNIKEITKIIKSINPNCYVVVDACQSFSYNLIDVKEWGIDALVFSPYKFYGPDGIAVLWVGETLARKLPRLLWGSGENHSPLSATTSVSDYGNFEIGTVSTAQVAALGEVFYFLSKLNWSRLTAKQRQLREYTVRSLLQLGGVEIYNHSVTSNILLFNIKGFHSEDVSSYLAGNKIFVRAGTFCSPFLRELIGRRSAIRISLAIYNNRDEIDSLINFLEGLRVDNCLQ